MAEGTSQAARLSSSDPLRVSRGDVVALAVAFILFLASAAVLSMSFEEGLVDGLRRGATGFALSLLGGVLIRMVWRWFKPKVRDWVREEFLDFPPQNR